MSQIQVPEHFEMTLETHGDTAFVRLGGEFDMACEECFDAALQQLVDQEIDTIVIDLSKLGFMDSSGISMLLAAHQRSQRAGFRIGIVPGTGEVKRVFELTGVDGVLPMLGDEEASARAPVVNAA